MDLQNVIRYCCYHLTPGQNHTSTLAFHLPEENRRCHEGGGPQSPQNENEWELPLQLVMLEFWRLVAVQAHQLHCHSYHAVGKDTGGLGSLDHDEREQVSKKKKLGATVQLPQPTLDHRR